MANIGTASLTIARMSALSFMLTSKALNEKVARKVCKGVS